LEVEAFCAVGENVDMVCGRGGEDRAEAALGCVSMGMSRGKGVGLGIRRWCPRRSRGFGGKFLWFRRSLWCVMRGQWSGDVGRNGMG